MGTPKIEWTHKGGFLVQSIETSASPERAWAAWAEPEKISQWWCERAEGEVRQGGIYTLSFDRFNFRVPYDVYEAKPPHLLVLHAAVPGMGEGILEVDIEPHEQQTRVRLTNSGFPTGPEHEDMFEGCVSGWKMSLGILKEYLEHYFGQPNAMFLTMLPAEFEYAQVLPFYTTAEGLSRWLTEPAKRGLSGLFSKPKDIGAPGSRYAFTMRNGARASGRVLALTEREVALGWEEIHGTLELKAFAMGPGKRMLCVRGFGWGMAAERAAEIERDMTAAVGRLQAVLTEAHKT
jgi:uncharacterized protein YndB with AHSA1/START domain